MARGGVSVQVAPHRPRSHPFFSFFQNLTSAFLLSFPVGPLEGRVSCNIGFTTVVNNATSQSDCVIDCPPGERACF